MKSNFLKSSSILRKFLIFNLIIFLVLGIFTFLYLNAIKPNLVKNRSDKHVKIINNSDDNSTKSNSSIHKRFPIKVNLNKVKQLNAEFLNYSKVEKIK